MSVVSPGGSPAGGSPAGGPMTRPSGSARAWTAPWALGALVFLLFAMACQGMVYRLMMTATPLYVNSLSWPDWFQLRQTMQGFYR